MSSAHAGHRSDRGRRVNPLMVFAWTWVGVPFGYGVYQLLLKVEALFSS